MSSRNITTHARGRHASHLSPDERFWPRVQAVGECWMWMGAGAPNYGRFLATTGTRDYAQAHRWSYERMVGPIPEGLVLDHLCRNRSCVNPDHLDPVPNVENVMRGISVHAVNARKTHCHRGHEFTPSNTFSGSAGRRVCRSCQAIKSANYRARKAVT